MRRKHFNVNYIEDITWLRGDTKINFSSYVEKIYHLFAALTREIFFNTRREVLYLQAAR